MNMGGQILGYNSSLYEFVIELSGADPPKSESSRKLLVPKMKKLLSKMFRSIIHDKDFEVSLAYESEHLLPPGFTSPLNAQYQISGLADANGKYSSRNPSSSIKAIVHSSLRRSGVLSLDRADVVVEITEWVEVPRKNLTIENSTISSNVSNESSASNNSEENSESVQSDSGINKTSNTSAEEQAAAEPATKKKLKKRAFRVPLKTVEELDEVQDWLYTDGEDANATEFEERLDQLKVVGDPIFSRLKEHTARPAAVEHARKYLIELKQIVKEWKLKKSWLPKERVDEVINIAEKLKTGWMRKRLSKELLD